MNPAILEDIEEYRSSFPGINERMNNGMTAQQAIKEHNSMVLVRVYQYLFTVADAENLDGYKVIGPIVHQVQEAVQYALSHVEDLNQGMINAIEEPLADHNTRFDVLDVMCSHVCELTDCELIR